MTLASVTGAVRTRMQGSSRRVASAAGGQGKPGLAVSQQPEDGAGASTSSLEVLRLIDATDAMDAWRTEGERRAETLRQSLLDVKNHANDLTGQINTRNRAAAQGERSRKQHSHIASGWAKPPQEQRIAVPQQDVDPAESAVLNAEEHLQDVRSRASTRHPCALPLRLFESLQ